jgi:hypothetical protein
MKSSVFWDITPCASLKVKRHFVGHVASIFRAGEYAKQDETSVEAGLFVTCFHAGFFLTSFLTLKIEAGAKEA